MPEKSQSKKKKRNDTVTHRRLSKGSGRHQNQKMKASVLYQYFLRHTDENHVSSIEAIKDYIGMGFEMELERRSLYRDIREINKMLLYFEEEIICIEDADKLFEDEDNDYLKTIIYDPHRKGYYMQRRPFDVDDIQILLQCLYSSKFVSEGQIERLKKSLTNIISEGHEDEIQRANFFIDENRTTNRSVLNSISTISTAMNAFVDGHTHWPEKVKFDYSEYVIDETRNQAELCNVLKQVVSPYQFIAKDGNIYLVAYHDEHQQMQIYSIDRMTNVSLTGEKRTGEEVFAAMDLTEYYLSDFRSYEASRRMVTIRFANSALEAVVERFGSTGKIRRIDSEYFEVTAHVETNSQFYNWLLTFGTEAKILKPEWAAEAFLKHIDNIRNTYTTKP